MSIVCINFLNFIFFYFYIDIIILFVYNNCCSVIPLSGCGSVWLERHLREVEAASSNLVTPIYLDSVKYRRIKGFCGVFALWDKYQLVSCFSSFYKLHLSVLVENHLSGMHRIIKKGGSIFRPPQKFKKLTHLA